MEKRALIVDDTKNIRLMLTKCMALEGYAVDSADNGRDGLNMAINNKYDIIFLDIKIPEISGTEVLRQLRKVGNSTPVIVITAYSTVKNAVECTKLGALTYLQKPFTIERIQNILRQITIDKIQQSEVNKAENKKMNPCKKIYLSEIETLIDEGCYDVALKKLKLALSILPNNSRIYHLLGRVYDLQGDKDLSEKFYKTEEIFKEKH